MTEILASAEAHLILRLSSSDSSSSESSKVIGMMHHDEGSIEETSSELSMRSKKKEKTKVLPEHYVSQKAIDDLCRRAKTVHPTVNYFHGELKSLQQYTRSLDSRLSSLETKVRRASQRSDGGIGDTKRKKSPNKFIKSSDDSKEEFPNSEDEGDPSPSAYIGTMAQQAQKWVSQVTIQIQESVYKDVFTVFDSGSDYNCVRADLIPIITGNDVRRKPKLLMGRSYLLHGWSEIFISANRVLA